MVKHLSFTLHYDESFIKPSGEDLQKAIKQSIDRDCRQIVRYLIQKNQNSRITYRGIFYNDQLEYIAMITIPKDGADESRYKEYVHIASDGELEVVQGDNGESITSNSGKISISSKLEISRYEREKAEILAKIGNKLEISVWESSKVELNQKLDEKLDKASYELDKASYATKAELRNAQLSANASVDLSDYDTRAIAETKYAKKSELASKLDSATYNSQKNNFALKTELANKVDTTTYEADKTNLATKLEVGNKLDTATYNSEKNSFATKSELTSLATKAELNQKADSSSLSQYLRSDEANAKYATKSEIAGISASSGGVSVDMSNYETSQSIALKYATKAEVNNKLDSSRLNAYTPTTELERDYAKKSELSSKVDTSALANYETTSHAEATYAKKSDLSSKADITSLSSYLQADTANSTYATKVELANKADTSSLASLATKAELANKLDTSTYTSEKQTLQNSISQKLDVSTYNQEKQNFATKAELSGVGGVSIDDTTPASNKTFSSNKIEARINELITQASSSDGDVSKIVKRNSSGDFAAHDVVLSGTVQITQANNTSNITQANVSLPYLNESGWLLKADKDTWKNTFLAGYAKLDDSSSGNDKTYSSSKIDQLLSSLPSSSSSSSSSNLNLDELAFNTDFDNNKMIFKRGAKPAGLPSEIDNITRSPYFRIPALALTDDGATVVLSDYRSDPGDQVKIGVVAAVSTDGAKTFSNKYAVKPIGNDALTRAMDSTILATKSGKILILNGAWKSGSENWIQANGSNSSNAVSLMTKASKSDNYATFTQREFTPANKPRDVRAFLGGVGNGLELYDGTLVFPIQYTKAARSIYAGFIYSEDDGESWKWGGLEVNGVSENQLVLDENGYICMIGRRDGSNFKDAYRLLKNNQPLKTLAGADSGLSVEELSGIKNRVPESQGTQSSAISFVTEAGVYVCLFTCPQNRLGRFNRDRITIYATDLTGSRIVPLCVLNYKKGGWERNTPFGGYACLAYNTNADGEKLLCAYEDDLGISLKDVSYLIPKVNEIFKKDNVCIGAGYKNYVKDELMAEYTASTFTKNKWSSTNGRFLPFDVYGDVSTDVAHNDLIKITTNTTNGDWRIKQRIRNISFVGIDLTNALNRLNSNKMTLDFDVFFPSKNSSHDNWEWIFQLGATPARVDEVSASNFSRGVEEGIRPYLGLGFEARSDNNNIKLNPVSKDDWRDTATNDVLRINKRLHFSIVIDMSSSTKTMKIYVENVLVNTYNKVRATGAKEFDYLIFGNALSLDKKQNIFIGNIRLYSKALSANEVAQNYRAAKAIERVANLA